MTFVLLLLLFAQFEPSSMLGISRIQEQLRLQDNLIQAILSKNKL